MAELFNNKFKEHTKTKPNNLETKYNSSINNLLLVVGLSLVNIVLLVTNSDTYFLFSAFIPYFVADYGMYFCGMYPEEYYYDVPDMVFEDKSFFWATIAVAAAFLLVYLLCWFLAKKKKVGAVIFSLVIFVIDTVVMLWVTGFSMESIFDIIIHVWVIAYLIIAIVTYFKMKKLPEEDFETDAEETIETDVEITYNSNVLRMADNEVKSRVLLEAEVPGYRIVYRRVKKINELIVNGKVYDEYEALIEFPHTLTALVDSHKIEVRYDDSNHMFIIFDGEQLAKKIRII